MLYCPNFFWNVLQVWMTGKDVYLQMTWSWPDKTWNILCSYCLQWNTSQSKFRNHYFLFLFAFSILSQLFLIWGCSKNIQYGSSHLMVQLLDCHHKGYRFTSMQGCFGMVSVCCSKLMWDQWGANSAREGVNKRSVHHTNQAIATVYCWYTQLISIIMIIIICIKE